MFPFPDVAPPGNTYGPRITFKTEGILPPSAVYVGPDDSLILSVRNPSFPTTVNLSYRLLTPEGILQNESFEFVAASVGAAPALKIIQPTEGFLISASISAPAASRGQVFVKFFLQRGTGSGDIGLGHVLLQEYVSLDDFIGFPQTPMGSSLNGRGWMHGFAGTAPPVGIDWSVTVPAGIRWIVRSIQAQLITLGAAPLRAVLLQVNPPAAAAVARQPINVGIAVLNITSLSWAPGNTASTQPNAQQMGLPAELIVSPGWIIRTVTTNLDPTDIWGAPNLVVEEFAAQ